MGHPFSQHRQTKVEHSRVGHITKGYKSGGAVKHPDEKQDRKLIRSMIDKAIHPDGAKGKHRMDRPKRAKGGAVKKKGNTARTIVNVITGGHPAGGAVPPGPPMAPPGPPMGIAGPPPGGMPPPGAGGPPMPLRAKGGRVQTPTGSGVAPINNSSKKTNGSPVYNASTRNGTQVSDGDGNNKDDGKDIRRGTPITFKSGGRVRSFYAKGGNVESPQGIAPATRLPGGSGGGKGRLAKEHRAERDYARPAR